MVDVTIITPTGDRSWAFSLCERWIARQDFTGSYEWIVVDDGQVPRTCTMGQRYIRIEPSPSDPPHTLSRNLLAAIRSGINGRAVLLVEDDDNYAPSYLTTYSDWLTRAALVGEGHARYYHLPTRQYRRMKNYGHASLAQTGINADLLPLLESLCKSHDPFIDLRLWAKGPASRYLMIEPTDSRGLHVSMKGLPGRAGIGNGHKPKGFQGDPELRKLREWIGEDVVFYGGE